MYTKEYSEQPKQLFNDNNEALLATLTNSVAFKQKPSGSKVANILGGKWNNKTLTTTSEIAQLFQRGQSQIFTLQSGSLEDMNTSRIGKKNGQPKLEQSTFTNIIGLDIDNTTPEDTRETILNEITFLLGVKPVVDYESFSSYSMKLVKDENGNDVYQQQNYRGRFIFVLDRFVNDNEIKVLNKAIAKMFNVELDSQTNNINRIWFGTNKTVNYNTVTAENFNEYALRVDPLLKRYGMGEEAIKELQKNQEVNKVTIELPEYKDLAQILKTTPFQDFLTSASEQEAIERLNKYRKSTKYNTLTQAVKQVLINAYFNIAQINELPEEVINHYSLLRRDSRKIREFMNECDILFQQKQSGHMNVTSDSCTLKVASELGASITKEDNSDTTNGLFSILDNCEDLLINTYISDHEERLQAFIEDSITNKETNLLVAPAGSGKTSNIVRLSGELNKTIVVATPTQAITKNQKEKIQEILLEYAQKAENEFLKMHLFVNYDVLFDIELKKQIEQELGVSYSFFFGSTNSVKNANEHDLSADIIFCVYDQIEAMKEQFAKYGIKKDILCIDEAHNVSTYQNINLGHEKGTKQSKMREMILARNNYLFFASTIYMTATPYNLPNIFDKKLRFHRENGTKKNVKLFTYNEQSGTTKVDTKVFYPNLIKQSGLKHEKNDKILVFNFCKMENFEETNKAIAEVLGVPWERTASINSTNKQDATDVRQIDNNNPIPLCDKARYVYNQLLQDKPDLNDFDLVISSPLLATGIDIQGVFNKVIVLPTNDFNMIPQTMERERTEADVYYFVQDKLFYPKKWCDKEERFVSDKTKPKTRTPQQNYFIKSWDTSITQEQAEERLLLNEYSIYELGANDFITDPFYAQNEDYKDFCFRFLGVRIITSMLNKLKISYSIDNLGTVVKNDGAKTEITKRAIEQKEITQEVINVQIKQLRGHEKKNEGKYALAHVLDSNSKQYKNVSVLLKAIAKNSFFDKHKSERIAEISHDIINSDNNIPKEAFILLMHESLNDTKSHLVTYLQQHEGSRVNEGDFLENVKGYITNIEDTKITKKRLIDIIAYLGYDMTERKKLNKIVDCVRKQHIEVTIIKTN